MFVGMPSIVQADNFLMGMVVGGIIFGEGGKTTANGAGDGNLLYVAPRIAERVTDPLGVRTIATHFIEFSSNNGNLDWKIKRGKQFRKFLMM